MPTLKPLILDGSTLEGGGQLVRVAFCLSAIIGIPVQIFNIRANRMSKGRSRTSASANLRRSGGGKHSVRSGKDVGSKSTSGSGEGSSAGAGAKESHLAAVLWLAGRCNALVKGGSIGSSEILFIPGAASDDTKSGKLEMSSLVNGEKNVISLERPGSVCLILQCLLPYLLFASPAGIQGKAEGDADTVTELTLRGGTNVSKAMSVDYVQHVFLPVLQRIVGDGMPDVQLDIVQRGWAGSASQVGEVKVRVQRSGGLPLKLENFNAVERGDVEKISVVIVAEGEKTRVDILDGLQSEIAILLGERIPVELIVNEESGDVRRLYVLLVAHTTNGYRLGRDFLGSGRRPRNAAELKKIIEEAVKKVIRDLSRDVKRGGCVDEHLQDQLVVFQALAKGEGRVDGGSWKNERKEDEAEVGDEEGSLHTRTVRWVCEKVLSMKALRGKMQGVEFGPGGTCPGVGWNWPIENTNDGRTDGSSNEDSMAQLSIKEEQ